MQLAGDVQSGAKKNPTTSLLLPSSSPAASLTILLYFFGLCLGGFRVALSASKRNSTKRLRRGDTWEEVP